MGLVCDISAFGMICFQQNWHDPKWTSFEAKGKMSIRRFAAKAAKEYVFQGQGQWCALCVI